MLHCCVGGVEGVQRTFACTPETTLLTSYPCLYVNVNAQAQAQEVELSGLPAMAVVHRLFDLLVADTKVRYLSLSRSVGICRCDGQWDRSI